jgi:MFS transporter, DHA1 family, multidrug resistance protein
LWYSTLDIPLTSSIYRFNMGLDYIADAPLGQLLNWASKGKYFAFPEDKPGFKIPWEEANVNEKEKELEASQETSSATTPLDGSRRDSKTEEEAIKREDVEARGLSQIPTSHSSARNTIGVVTTRTRTREQTTPYSRERFEVEREEEIERRQSSIIAPQRTADGIILVDWYTTDDPENPQNWNSWKKAWVAFVIFMYTFSVYSASAIYTSAEPQIMAKFGVGQSKASLGLSMYVLGYGIGPM